MAKTYNTIPTVNTGDVYQAASHNNIVTNVNNYRVPPMCMIYKTAAQSIANNTGTIISWDAEYLDTDSMWSSGATISCTTAGIYLTTVAVQWQTNTAGIRRANLQKNITGTTYDTAKRVWEWNSGPMGTVGWGGLSYSALVSMAANDTLAVGVVQNSGVALNINGDATSLEVTFSMLWVGQAT